MYDLISRQAAIDAADKIIERDTSGNNAVVNAMMAWSEYIRALPSAQPERKKGKWIHGKEIARWYLRGELTHVEYEDYHCSECGYTAKNIRWNVDGELVDRYCSVCGADMRQGG